MSSILVLFHRSHLNPRMELIAETLQSEGHNIEALCWDRGGSSNAESDTIPSTRVGKVGQDASLWNLLLLPYVYFCFMSNIYKKEYDIIYSGHISLLPLAVVIGKLGSHPVIYDVVELYWEGYNNRKSRLANGITILITSIEHFFLYGVEGVTVIDSNENVIRRRYEGYTTNIETIYNVPRQKPVPEQQDEEEGQTVVYSGAIHKSKGIYELAEAFALIRDRRDDVSLLLIGDGGNKTVKKTQQLFHEQGISDHVTFTGQVSYSKVHDLLYKADIGVAPYQPVLNFERSRWNARKIPDYMNAGLPVVAPAFGGFPEIIEKTKGGITVDSSDPVALANGIEKLLDDPEMARSLGRNGRRAIENEYSWEHEQEKLLRVIRRVLPQQ